MIAVRNRWRVSALALLGLAAAAFAVAQMSSGSAVAGHTANHLPADKVAAAGSTVEVAGPNENVTLLKTQIRSSNNVDLLLQATLECSIVTDVKTVGDDNASATGTLESWVEVDGEPVPVSTADEDGKVTFCNRSYRRQTSLFNDEDATIETFFSTKGSHGFNWIRLEVPSGIHDITLKGRLHQETVGDATAEVAVGNRTLTVEPVRLPVGATVDPGTS